MRQDEEQPFFQMSGVSKSYGGAVALDSADLAVRSGRIHAVLGENGAGKSTLLKVMSGVLQPDDGTMHLDGRQVSFASPSEANAAGIVCVYQELSLIPDLSGLMSPVRARATSIRSRKSGTCRCRASRWSSSRRGLRTSRAS
jgi:ribose transport system ATP-binding protein